MLPESWRSRACVVYDVAEPETWFDAVPEFGTARRRREWMLSRIAEKMLRRRGVTGAHVSYSHSGDFGAAAIDDAPVGIDVEVMRAISSKAAHLFLTDEEEAEAARCSLEGALLHFWSAKEARWKQLRGAVLTLKRAPLALLEETGDGLRFDYAESRRIGEIVVALTRPTS